MGPLRHDRMVALLDFRVWIAAALLAAAAFAWGYVRGHSAGESGEHLRQAAEIEKWRTNADAAAELYEQERAKKAPAVRTVYQTKEIVRAKNPDFASCRTGADGLRALYDRIAIANTGEPAPTVRAAAGAGGR